MNIIDTHTHLNASPLYEQRNSLIKNAIEKGVSKFVIVGYDLETSKKAIEVCNEYSDYCYALIGIHPSEINNDFDEELKEIESMLSNKCVIGIGEIGLDYHYEGFDKDKQKECFVKQIKLASKYNLPISIHMRDATKDVLDILKDNKEYLKRGGIMHCYSGSYESALEFIKLGFYISFGGPITFKNNKVGIEMLPKLPLDKLLFETDAPYLAPHPLRGTTNIPENIIYVIDKVSYIFDITKEELSNIENANFKRLFNL